MKKIKIGLLLICLLLITGCDAFNSKEEIDIVTTIYPVEYIAERIYGDNAVIQRMYPLSSDINTYTFTEKQIKDYSKNDLFVYIGESNERELAKDMIKYNKNITIIDASYGIDSINTTSDVWLNPANFLMLANNISSQLQNNITSNYITTEINNNYQDLKVDITELETKFKTIADNSVNKTIISYDESLNFLERYGFTVISLTKDGQNIEKNITTARNIYTAKQCSYIFVMDNFTGDNTLINSLINNYGATKATIKNLSTITEEEYTGHKDYISLMEDNLQTITQETYK